MCSPRAYRLIHSESPLHSTLKQITTELNLFNCWNATDMRHQKNNMLNQRSYYQGALVLFLCASNVQLNGSARADYQRRMKWQNCMNACFQVLCFFSCPHAKYNAVINLRFMLLKLRVILSEINLPKGGSRTQELYLRPMLQIVLLI